MLLDIDWFSFVLKKVAWNKAEFYVLKFFYFKTTYWAQPVLVFKPGGVRTFIQGISLKNYCIQMPAWSGQNVQDIHQVCKSLSLKIMT